MNGEGGRKKYLTVIDKKNKLILNLGTLNNC
jgi:hypothetical protein